MHLKSDKPLDVYPYCIIIVFDKFSYWKYYTQKVTISIAVNDYNL